MNVKKESEKAGLKLNIQETKIMGSSPIILCQIDGKNTETVTDFIFLCSKITADGDLKNALKAGLKLNIRKLRSWHPVPSLHSK